MLRNKVVKDLQKMQSMSSLTNNNLYFDRNFF